jgi:23S rRNA (adenine2030-N6)-methyltransferase
MNYRHIYHAGNFADVIKHLAMTLVIDYLKKKDAPFCVIDAHGGLGLYDLESEQAQKTQEWKEGIGRFDEPGNADFNLYYSLAQDYLKNSTYPGSPLVAAQLLRHQDRLIVNELHPEDFQTLRSNLRAFKNIRVTELDAYECIRANIPPKEKRGLVLIDPPFEKKDEFGTLVRQMEEWKKRFANGVFMIWYPVKAHLAVDEMKDAARALGLPRTWSVETMIRPRWNTEGLSGCGLVIFNTPFQIPERIEALLPFLAKKMDLLETPCEWLTPA